MIKTHTPPGAPRPARRPRAGHTVGVWLRLEDYAAFLAIAAAEKRTPSDLARLVLLDFLAQKKSSAAGPASAATPGCGPEKELP